MRRIFGGIVIGAVALAQFGVLIAPANAAVSDWQKGANVAPTSTTDFSSGSFQQSLRNLKATGANSVALVVPYYQSNTGSTDVQQGYNTPTDDSLASAIDFAHSIGLAVSLKVHIDAYSGDWRAYINPGDRTGWFNNYGNVVVHVAQIGQAHHAEMIVIGTELVSMAASNMNSSNTQHWLDLISNVRKIYSGKLTYGANSTNNNDNAFQNEKKYIGFWSALDYAGLSVYYNLNTNDNSVDALKGAWDYWNKNDLKPFQQTVGKPLLFIEIGYRSVTNAHQDPWNWQRSGAIDQTEQANDYEALMSYWNDYSYMQGVYWWNWETNPNAGGNGNTGYTVQNKPAQTTLTNWFTNPPGSSSGGGSTGGGGSGGTPAFTVSASTNPASAPSGSTVAINSTVTDTGSTLSGGVVDMEVYDPSNTKVFQKFFDNQTINQGQTANYSAQWQAGGAGTYRVALGVFSSGWAQNYAWSNNAAQVSVTTASGGGGSGGGGSIGSAVTDVWWPTDGASVSGVQPFKAMLDNTDISQYQMYWQVDGGALVQMANSMEGYPHKEALVDLSGWHWKGNGPYTVTFVSKNNSGTVISQKSVNITVY
jgi:hypothetical protein